MVAHRDLGNLIRLVSAWGHASDDVSKSVSAMSELEAPPGSDCLEVAKALQVTADKARRPFCSKFNGYWLVAAPGMSVDDIISPLKETHAACYFGQITETMELLDRMDREVKEAFFINADLLKGKE